jgi:hypothetical protein
VGAARSPAAAITHRVSYQLQQVRWNVSTTLCSHTACHTSCSRCVGMCRPRCAHTPRVIPAAAGALECVDHAVLTHRVSYQLQQVRWNVSTTLCSHTACHTSCSRCVGMCRPRCAHTPRVIPAAAGALECVDHPADTSQDPHHLSKSRNLGCWVYLRVSGQSNTHDWVLRDTARVFLIAIFQLSADAHRMALRVLRAVLRR